MDIVKAIESDPDSELLLLEPREQFDSAIIGVVERFNQQFVLYSKKKVLEAIRGEDDTEDDGEAVDNEMGALEYYEFNIRGGWVGDATPGFLLDDGPNELELAEETP